MDLVINKINYSDYYVAFLDILGFKKLVSSQRQEDKSKIEEYFALIDAVTAELERIVSKKNLGSIIISDSVILSIPSDGSPDVKLVKLRNLCVAVGQIQKTLAKNNIWLRGAISCGKAYFDPIKKNIVGEAYINAYLLERDQALFPRVILDNKLIKDVNMTSAQAFIDKINLVGNLHARFSAQWSTDIIFDWEAKRKLSDRLNQDTAFFVDYLSPVFENIHDLRTITKNIGHNIYGDNDIYLKFKWVVNYLLASCECKVQRLGSPNDRPWKQELSKIERL